MLHATRSGARQEWASLPGAFSLTPWGSPTADEGHSFLLDAVKTRSSVTSISIHLQSFHWFIHRVILHHSCALGSKKSCTLGLHKGAIKKKMLQSQLQYIYGVVSTSLISQCWEA